MNYFGVLDIETCEIQSILFSPEFIYRNDNDLKQLFHFTVATHIEGVQILQLRKDEADALAMISGNMHMVYNTWKGPTGDHAFYHWLSLFLIHCERLQTDNLHCDEIALEENSKLILQFNQLLEKNYRSEYKVDYYLFEMGISVKALSKLTKERYKLSPKALIDKRRTLEMKRLLKGTTIPSKNIAYDLGFDEPTNMTKYFKKDVGTTPNAFREEN